MKSEIDIDVLHAIYALGEASIVCADTMRPNVRLLEYKLAEGKIADELVPSVRQMIVDGAAAFKEVTPEVRRQQMLLAAAIAKSDQ